MINPAEGRSVHGDSNGAADRILNIDGVGQDETQDSLFQGVSMGNIGRVIPSASGYGGGPFPKLEEDLGMVLGDHQFVSIGEKAKDAFGRSGVGGGGMGEEEVEEAEGGAEVGGVGGGERKGGEEGGGEGIRMGNGAFEGAVVEEIGVRNWGVWERGEAGGAVSEEEGIMESGGEGKQWRSNVFRHFYVFHCSHFHLHFCVSPGLLQRLVVTGKVTITCGMK